MSLDMINMNTTKTYTKRKCSHSHVIHNVNVTEGCPLNSHCYQFAHISIWIDLARKALLSWQRKLFFLLFNLTCQSFPGKQSNHFNSPGVWALFLISWGTSFPVLYFYWFMSIERFCPIFPWMLICLICMHIFLVCDFLESLTIQHKIK